MVRENPRWGERRIQGELLKLGYRVSNSTIPKIVRCYRSARRPGAQARTWSQFLRAHARAVLACDFLTVDSVRLGVLYVLVFLEISSRRVIFCNATAHPDSAWVAQQARNVASELDELKIPIKVLIHDSKYTTTSTRSSQRLASGSPEPRSGARVRTAPARGYWAPCGESVWIG